MPKHQGQHFLQNSNYNNPSVQQNRLSRGQRDGARRITAHRYAIENVVSNNDEDDDDDHYHDYFTTTLPPPQRHRRRFRVRSHFYQFV